MAEKMVQVLGREFPVSVEDIQFSVPRDQKYGDLSTTLPFILAKKSNQNPRVIGEKIAGRIRGIFDFISDIEIAGNGFLNFHLSKNFFLRYLIRHADRKPGEKHEKVIVEHTSINPNKSAHIGHLRNSCLGDSLARCLMYSGYQVEVQNYIDDTGVQVADVVWGLMVYQKKSLDQIKKIKNLAAYLWELYARVHRLAEKNGDIGTEIRQVLKKIENKVHPEFMISDYISGEVLLDHIKLMDRLGIRYDLLVRESDIIELDFFNRVAEILRDRKVMLASRDPEKKGCWVIWYKRENIEKIVVRSDETVTYIGKDIAYAMWKMGILQRDFFYSLFYRYPDGRQLFSTSATEVSGNFCFGRAQRVYNVIGQRQSYLQNIISQVLDEVGTGYTGRNFVHFSYEMVSLTPRCIQEMGFKLSPGDQRKSTVDVSGRKGIAIKAEELIDKLTEKSLEEVRQRNPGMETDNLQKIAGEIAVGALRYFMVKFNSNSIIAFDFHDALSFEGDTGPYLQYTLVRLNSIFRKMGDPVLDLKKIELDMSVLDENELKLFHEILLHVSSMDNQIDFALDSHELSVVTSFTYALCQKCNHYYHQFPIISEKSDERKMLRLSLIFIIKKKLEVLFDLIGIPVPERM